MTTSHDATLSQPRSQALPGNALPGRLCLPTGLKARQSLASSAFPGRDWERGALLHADGLQRYGHEFLDEFAGIWVDQPHHAVKAGRGDDFPVRLIRDRVHWPRLAHKLRYQFGVGRLVDAHLARAVEAAAGRESAAVFVEGQGEDAAGHGRILAHLIGVVADDALRLAVHLVEPWFAVGAGDQQFIIPFVRLVDAAGGHFDFLVALYRIAGHGQQAALERSRSNARDIVDETLGG